ncbi:MAG: bifunctional glutamate N-acetyltransferase/amino-acid acetyltransferase ArgJ [Dehalococcoidia bacterium]|nr:bifunctional glutamate N-acetyltransferase/amino-acid acetyltransferase ArgJ [Dehalococcoidia bacterium]
MSVSFERIPSGTITSARGFLAGATPALIKKNGELDLAVLYSRVPCAAAGLFSTNQIKSAPVILSQKNLLKGRAQAIVANSGCANACLGEQGMADARKMARLGASKLGIVSENVLVASTGVIGVPLPMDKISSAISEIRTDREGGHDFARAIMTTDTTPKEIALKVICKEGEFVVGGAAKGAGMIHPDMATMLCFITTDARVEGEFLHLALKRAVDVSFNMVSIDGDTSPSDSVFLLANGMADNEMLDYVNGEAFQVALREVCIYLARSIAQDGEGATRLIQVSVTGAKDEAQAHRAARTVVSSPLVKTAVYGNDPNWGRVVVAMGRSGAEVAEEKLDVYLNDVQLMQRGRPVPFDEEEMRQSLRGDEVCIGLCLNLGEGEAVAWGCDLSPEYVKINSEYTT